MAISLKDLTYGSTLISSQTYDYFFPLMMTAVIYLLFVMLLTWLFGILERRLRSNERR